MNFFKRIFGNGQNKIGRLDYFLIFLLLIILLIVFNYFLFSSTSKKLTKEYNECVNNIYYSDDSYTKNNKISKCYEKYSSELFNKYAINGKIILLIFLIIIFFPTKKRLNDLDMSGWHYLWFIAPLFFIIFLKIFIYKTNGYNPIIDSLNFLWLIVPIFLLFLIFKKGKITLEKDKTPNNLENDLQKIKELFEKGLISEQEYEAKKKKILDL